MNNKLDTIEDIMKMPTPTRFPYLFGVLNAKAFTIVRLGVDLRVLDEMKHYILLVRELIHITPKEYILESDINTFSKFAEIAKDMTSLIPVIEKIDEEFKEKLES